MSAQLSSAWVTKCLLEQCEKNSSRTALSILKLEDNGLCWSVDITFEAFQKRVLQFNQGLRVANLVPGSKVILAANPSPELFAFAVAALMMGFEVLVSDRELSSEMVRVWVSSEQPSVVVAPGSGYRFWFLDENLRAVPLKLSGDKGGFLIRSLSVFGSDLEEPSLENRLSDENGISIVGVQKDRVKYLYRKRYSQLHQDARKFFDLFPAHEKQVDLTEYPIQVLMNLMVGASSLYCWRASQTVESNDFTFLIPFIREHGVSSVTVSPEFMKRIALNLNSRRESLGRVRRVAVGGTPMPKYLSAATRTAFPNAEGFSFCEIPDAGLVARASMRDIRQLNKPGYLAGKLRNSRSLKILDIPREVTELREKELDSFSVRIGDVGELVIEGNSREELVDSGVGYCTSWTRTGELGYMDDDGFLWLVGRTVDNIVRAGRTLPPYPAEARVEILPEVARAALISSSSYPEGVIVIEPKLGLQALPEHSIVEAVSSALALSIYEGVPIRLVKKIPLCGYGEANVDRKALQEEVRALD
ncbi:MAG: class I adenylate-forming enzyme family protein [Myxococcota bacterium]|nr:class I adenylate-forming enzyme family protein [Myxococcota bacterium]